jgi:hypothetical protein
MLPGLSPNDVVSDRQVKGSLFADYVRMIRSQKQIAWDRILAAEDRRYLRERIGAEQWYPMATFERLGDAILREIARGDLIQVRMWGRYQVDQQRRIYTSLVADGDPVETLCRFRVLRSTLFNFEALTVPLLHDDEAHMVISYHMGNPAEEAAAHQTMGFFERLLELSGASTVSARFIARSWAGDAETRLELQWLMGLGAPR